MPPTRIFQATTMKINNFPYSHYYYINTFLGQNSERMQSSIFQNLTLKRNTTITHNWNRKRKNQSPYLLERLAESSFSINDYENARICSKNFIAIKEKE